MPAVVKGYVTFRLGEREYATSLDEIREVVRLTGLAQLPGMPAPMAGVIELRGVPVPVMDLRPGGGTGRGDVLVLTDPAGLATGVAVDEVTAVRAVEQLASTSDPTLGLPDYVVEMLRDTATGGPLMRVDLRRMLDLATV